MTDLQKKPTSSANADSTKTVLDLKGSEQHHDLKNQPGEDANEDHASDKSSDNVSDEIEDAIKSADDETAIAAELKNSID